ncbi:thialysine N-epsilon-acetyltransferase-like isoform X2 [Heteronotia binoei]|uniref:thialysine N-epsilon-acetyltransferase-like isoform X2 n=1 Tax=Heteronotia binoei TaxID=13085 RepID=UPI00293074D6|nr:thialysine N-epsilon-acetyltransferase-like isoform X2 [Heteronotia binoei]
MAEVAVRPCKAEDCPQVVRLIRELAEFENLSEQVKISDQDFCEDGFGKDPFYKCLVAEVPPEPHSQDGKGIGKKLMSSVAQMGLQQGCTQMRLAALDWNRSAIDFYLRRGAVDLTAKEGWHVFRFEADAMRGLALGEPRSGQGPAHM